MALNVDPASGREIILTEAFAYNGQYEVKATGFKGIATAGTLTNVDFPIGAEDRHMSGIHLLLKNHHVDDTVGLSVVDVDNLLGYGAGLVLKNFGINWNVNDERNDQGINTFNFVARIPAGMYIRVSYNSAGLINVIVKLNAYLHKKLA